MDSVTVDNLNTAEAIAEIGRMIAESRARLIRIAALLPARDVAADRRVPFWRGRRRAGRTFAKERRASGHEPDRSVLSVWHLPDE